MNRVYNFFAFVTLAIFLTLSVGSAFAFWGDTVDDAWNAFNNGDYQKAYEIARKHIDNAYSQLLIGYLHEEGLA